MCISYDITMISFITIGRNESWRLEKCLSAIKRLATSDLKFPYEIIYVDSQSTDGSIEFAQQYANKIFMITGDCSAAIGRNVGAKEAKGDILFFIDGDMELREGVLSTILNEIGSLHYPFMAGVENDMLFDNDWQFKDERPRQTFKEGAEWYESKPSTGMFVIERWLWEDIGGMDSRFAVSEDHDLGFRLCVKGYLLLRMGRLWVNHYTRDYAVRTGYLKFRKYEALLARRHFFNRFAQRTIIGRFYSEYALFICIILSVVFTSFYLMIPYCFLLLFRSMRVIQRTTIRLNWIKVVYDRFRKDILFIYAFLFFHPAMPELEYKCVKK